jgi:hypothetical protein
MAIVTLNSDTNIETLNNETLYTLFCNRIVCLEKTFNGIDEHVYINEAGETIYKKIEAGFGLSVKSEIIKDFSINDLKAFRESGYKLAWY